MLQEYVWGLETSFLEFKFKLISSTSAASGELFKDVRETIHSVQLPGEMFQKQSKHLKIVELVA